MCNALRSITLLLCQLNVIFNVFVLALRYVVSWASTESCWGLMENFFFNNVVMGKHTLINHPSTRTGPPNTPWLPEISKDSRLLSLGFNALLFPPHTLKAAVVMDWVSNHIINNLLQLLYVTFIKEMFSAGQFSISKALFLTPGTNNVFLFAHVFSGWAWGEDFLD